MEVPRLLHYRSDEESDMNHDRKERERPRSTRDAGLGLPRPVVSAFGVVAAVTVLLVLIASRGPTYGPQEAAPVAVAAGPAALMEGRLPMEVNERVERWVQRFLTTRRAEFETYLVREGLYGGMILESLRARGMPEELLYLAMIESGFSPFATSSVAASGVWQFMGPTARAYGLTVDAWVDERRDPIRATAAALDYLQELHEQFGSWYLAAAAYNAGPSRVSSALRRNGVGQGGDEAFYWKIIHDLPLETREYVPKILAAALLAGQAEHFGFEVERDLPYLFDRVLLPGGTSLVSVADALELPHSLIRQMNPHLIRGVTPPGRSYLVRVPQGESVRVVAALSGFGSDGGVWTVSVEE
jgi:membrane-bound lytic murein transglycosylase D